MKCLRAGQSIARVKAAQRLRGIGNGCMRQPLQPLDKTELEVFRKQLEPFF